MTESEPRQLRCVTLGRHGRRLRTLVISGRSGCSRGGYAPAADSGVRVSETSRGLGPTPGLLVRQATTASPRGSRRIERRTARTLASDAPALA